MAQDPLQETAEESRASYIGDKMCSCKYYHGVQRVLHGRETDRFILAFALEIPQNTTGSLEMTGREKNSPFKRSSCLSSPTEQKRVFNFRMQLITFNVNCKQTDFSLGRTSSILQKDSEQKCLQHRFIAYANVLNLPFK